MRDGLSILAGMTDSDLAWLVENGEVRNFPAGKPLIHAGQRLETLYVLLEGEIEIVTPEGVPVDTSGAGDVIGEMSLIEDLRPSVVVHALTPLRALAVPHDVLTAHLAEDTAFAARLYRTLARFLSHRLRGHMARLGFGAAPAEVANSNASPGDAATMADRVARLKRLIEQGDG